MRRNQTWLLGAALGAAGALAAPALHAQANPAAPAAAQTEPRHANLFEVAAVLGRQKAQALEGPARRSARALPGAASYAAALALMGRDQTDSAVAALHTAVRADSAVARYHGDLAFALAAAGHFDSAADEYRVAFRLQGGNGWYAVGLGASQVALQLWTQAAASFTLAVATDSAVIIKPLIGPAGEAFQSAGMRDAGEAWAKMAVVRFPDEPVPWLWLANYAFGRRDTTGMPDTATGLPAIRRYRTMEPDDHAGQMIYADFLVSLGQDDSAVALVREAIKDTTKRPLAVPVLFNAGGHYIQHGNFDSATVALTLGRSMAAPQYYPRFDLYLAISRLKQLQKLFNDAAQNNDCRKAPVVDTMLVSITAQTNGGMPADSGMANQILGALPRYRTAIDNFKKNCGR